MATLSRQFGWSIGYDADLRAIRTAGVRGRLEPEDALRRLLRSSGLELRQVVAGVYRIEAQRRVVPSPSAAPTEQIVVVGTKRREMLATVPFALSVVSLGDGRLAGRAVTTAEALEGAGDVQLTNLGPGRNRLFIRGIADSAFAGPTQSTVGIYLDDARINFNMPDPDLRLVDVDRVEILKGPQGSLYGTGALAGIYRMVPNKPIDGETSGQASLGLSSVAHGATGGDVEAVLNLPLANRDGALRFVGYAISDAGWIDDTGRGKANVNRVITKGARVSAKLAVAPGWTIEAAGAAQSIAARDSQYAVSVFGPRARSTALAEPSDNDFLHARLTVSGALDALDLVSTTAIVSHKIRNRYDASAAASAFALSAPLAVDERQSLTLATHETRISAPSLQRPWVLGVSFLKASSTFSDEVVPARADPLLLIRRDVFEAALFGENSIALSNSIDATAGLRLSVTASHDEAGIDREERVTRFALTPMLALRWHPDPRVQVYGRFASATRPGGINPSGAPVSFRSDRLESFEAGTRLSTVDARFKLTIDAFQVRWTNIQSDMLQPNGLVATANVGTGKNHGVDISANAGFGAGWHIDAGAILQDAELYRSAAGQGRRREAGLPSVPSWSVRFGPGRSLDLWLGRLSLEMSGRVIGRSKLSFDPSFDRRMGGYATIDAQASYSQGDWRVTAAGTNLPGSGGDTFAFGNPFSIRLLDQRVPVRPRAVTLRVERRF